MMKATPGPWSAHDGNVRTGLDDDGPSAIATCYGPFGVASANAHLIAAAPDLLTACMSTLDYSNKQVPPEWVRDQMRAAIAKAEGN